MSYDYIPASESMEELGLMFWYFDRTPLWRVALDWFAARRARKARGMLIRYGHKARRILTEAHSDF